MTKWTICETKNLKKDKIRITEKGKIYLPSKIAKTLTHEYCYIMKNEINEIGIKETNERENTLKIYKKKYHALITFKNIFEFGYIPQKYEYEIEDGIIRIKRQA